MVKIDYTITLENGTVVDTTMEDVARDNNITKQKYEPVRFFVDPNEKRVPPELVTSVIGKTNGSHEIVVVQDMYGEYNDSLVFVAPYEYTLNLTETVNVTLLEGRGLSNITLNRTFKEKSWNATIINISEDNSTVTIRRFPHVNDTFNVNGIDERVVDVDEEEGVARIRVDVENGERRILVLELEGQQTFAWATVTINESANRVYIDFNDPLAGKDATIEYWVRDVLKSS